MIYKKLACRAAAIVVGATVIAVPAQARFRWSALWRAAQRTVRVASEPA